MTSDAKILRNPDGFITETGKIIDKQQFSTYDSVAILTIINEISKLTNENDQIIGNLFSHFSERFDFSHIKSIDKLNIFFDLCKKYESSLNEIQFQKYMDLIFATTVTNNLIREERYNHSVIKILLNYFEYCKKHFHTYTSNISKAMNNRVRQEGIQNTTENELINDRILSDLCQSALTVSPAFENQILAFFENTKIESYWAKVLLDEFDKNKFLLSQMFYKIQCCIARSIPDYDEAAVAYIIKTFIMK